MLSKIIQGLITVFIPVFVWVVSASLIVRTIEFIFDVELGLFGLFLIIVFTGPAMMVFIDNK